MSSLGSFGDRREFPVRDYDLAATLNSGQAFRWNQSSAGWVGIIQGTWVCLRPGPRRITAFTSKRQRDWAWLISYLQLEVELAPIVDTFPDEPPMRAAVQACRGLRLLRQPVWECLASFILSSTKQIAQIRQIVSALCRTFGEPVVVPPGFAPEFAFPSAERLALASESELRHCKMGFRAPYLLGTAREVACGSVDLNRLATLSLENAREELMRLPGVGRKIADCVLLFGCGFAGAFPVDVWVLKALQSLYFPRCRVLPRELRHFADTHFGPFAGYAQQYLFHYMRTTAMKV